MGAYVTDLVLSQNYFETIFTRIPKKISDDIVQWLKAEGLNSTPVGNGGQGGADRRGGDDGRARPASVKACSPLSPASLLSHQVH
jgi:pre-mRNA-splicing factor 38B